MESAAFCATFRKAVNMSFVPALDYESLLKQASALCIMATAQEKQLSFYRKKDYSLAEARIVELELLLESEKAMNATLTNELEKWIHRF